MSILRKIGLMIMTGCLILTILFAATACSNIIEEGTNVNGNFITVEVDDGYYNGLIYEANTRVVYIKAEGGNRLAITPYISENGYFCRYIDGELVEIIN